MKALAKTILDLPWIVLLLLTIFFDGVVGAIVRLGKGTLTLTKVVGVVLLASFLLSVVSFIGLPPFLGWIFRAVCVVCWVADIITVAVYKRFVLFTA